MRKTVAIVLVVLLTAGCATTTRRADLSTSPSVPNPTSGESEKYVVGVVLPDGSEVRFVEPATVEADGTVVGEVAVESPSRPARGRITRTHRYAAGQVSGYLISEEERRTGGVTTIGKIFLYSAAALGIFIGAVLLTCDDDDLIC